MKASATIKIASHAGACYGVERALELTRKAIEDNAKVSTYGEIIHNPCVVEALESKGVSVIKEPKDADGTVVLRSHGVTPQVEAEISKHAKIVDATCPFVKKAQLVAKNLGAAHEQVVIVGEAGHPEVEALVAYAKLGGAEVYVASEGTVLESTKLTDVGVLSQTTQSEDTFQKVVNCINKRGVKYCVKNTICSATTERQASAIELAKEVDVMIVLGGKNSANTTRLFELCKENCPSSFHIERPLEFDSLEKNLPKSNLTIGITAGASTPQSQISELQFLIENRD